MLKLHVTTKYLSWRKGRLWNVERMAEIKKKTKKKQEVDLVSTQTVLLRGFTHCQSMKGSFPRDCLISAYLHLLAKHSHGRNRHWSPWTHRHSADHWKSFMSNIWGSISAAGIPSKIAGVTWSSVCSVSAGLHGIYFLKSESHGYSVS